MPARQNFRIEFKPHPRLYANANDPVLLLGELRQLGDLELTCDLSSVPHLDELAPEGSYISWSGTLATDQDAAAINEVFEFVDGDCDLRVEHMEMSIADFGCEPDIEVPAASEVRAAPSFPVDPEPVSAHMDREHVAEAVRADVTAAQSVPAKDGDTAQQSARETAPSATIRVDLDRVDRLIDLVGELVINQAMLTQRVYDAGIGGSSSIALGLEDLEHLTREIQDSVMAIRAQPVRSLFQRMSRIVREAAQATEKHVRLKTEGEGTEIDKTVIERLVDPMTHMIRNAIDHGLESPEAREAAGKPAEGVVLVSAAHRSGRVVIEISDDGAGIDRTRVREIAVSKGLIPADAQLSDSDIDNLLFMPGFSTASSISNLSGRGVGMDVVKRSIQALGGRISISSELDVGTTFSMSLPLTLAVLDGMVVSAHDQTLVVPLTAIIETLRPTSDNVHAMGSHARAIGIRGDFVPLIDIGYELGFRPAPMPASQGVAILVETESGARVAMLADTIQDQRQVVIKSLESNYGRINGIAAATILGDGRVALIVDVDAIVSNSGGRKDADRLVA